MFATHQAVSGRPGARHPAAWFSRCRRTVRLVTRWTSGDSSGSGCGVGKRRRLDAPAPDLRLGPGGATVSHLSPLTGGPRWSADCGADWGHSERNKRSDRLLPIQEIVGDDALDFVETRIESPRVTRDAVHRTERSLRRRASVGASQRIELTGSQPAIEAPGARTKISTRRFCVRALGLFEGTRGWCGP